jgi:hypothetical protein
VARSTAEAKPDGERIPSDLDPSLQQKGDRFDRQGCGSGINLAASFERNP